jgi:hypothetical protein
MTNKRIKYFTTIWFYQNDNFLIWSRIVIDIDVSDIKGGDPLDDVIVLSRRR